MYKRKEGGGGVGSESVGEWVICSDYFIFIHILTFPGKSIMRLSLVRTMALERILFVGMPNNSRVLMMPKGQSRAMSRAADLFLDRTQYRPWPGMWPCL